MSNVVCRALLSALCVMSWGAQQNTCDKMLEEVGQSPDVSHELEKLQRPLVVELG